LEGGEAPIVFRQQTGGLAGPFGDRSVSHLAECDSICMKRRQSLLCNKSFYRGVTVFCKTRAQGVRRRRYRLSRPSGWLFNVTATQKNKPFALAWNPPCQTGFRDLEGRARLVARSFGRGGGGVGVPFKTQIPAIDSDSYEPSNRAPDRAVRTRLTQGCRTGTDKTIHKLEFNYSIFIYRIIIPPKQS